MSREPKRMTRTRSPFRILNDGTLTGVNCVDKTQVIAPEEATDIEEFAFYKCLSLKTVVFTGKVHKINRNIFEDCPALEKIIFMDCSNLEYLDIHAFSGLDKKCEVHFPQATLDEFNKAFEHLNQDITCKPIDLDDLLLSKPFSIKEANDYLLGSTER